MEIAKQPKIRIHIKHININYHQMAKYLCKEKIWIFPININWQVANIQRKPLLQNDCSGYASNFLISNCSILPLWPPAKEEIWNFGGSDNWIVECRVMALLMLIYGYFGQKPCLSIQLLLRACDWNTIFLPILYYLTAWLSPKRAYLGANTTRKFGISGGWFD